MAGGWHPSASFCECPVYHGGLTAVTHDPSVSVSYNSTSLRHFRGRCSVTFPGPAWKGLPIQDRLRPHSREGPAKPCLTLRHVLGCGRSQLLTFCWLQCHSQPGGGTGQCPPPTQWMMHMDVNTVNGDRGYYRGLDRPIFLLSPLFLEV